MAVRTEKIQRFKLPVWAVAVIGLVVCAIVFAAAFFGGKLIGGIFSNQPVSTPPIAATLITPTPTQSNPDDKVVKITAEELLKQVIENPNRYEVGTVFQITGVVITKYNVAYGKLGPNLQGWSLLFVPEKKFVAETNIWELVDRGFFDVAIGDKVTIRATLTRVFNDPDYINYKTVYLEHAFLISKE